MRIVTPYESLQEAKRSLDNGGRFYNIFTHADDQEITSAEFSTASHSINMFSYSMIHYHLATQILDANELSILNSLFDEKLTTKINTLDVPQVDVSQFPWEAEENAPVILRGQGEIIDDDGHIMVSAMIGKMTTRVPSAVSGAFNVLKLSLGDQSCRVLIANISKVNLQEQSCWGGFIRHQVDKSGQKFGPAYLEAQLCSA